MSKIKRLILLSIIIFIFIGGMNISNQGINHLTLDDRAPVFACNYEEGSLNLQLLSKGYNISPELLISKWQYLRQGAQNQGQQGIEYINKSWLIFKAVFLINSLSLYSCIYR